MAGSQTAGTGKLALGIAAFVVLGIPLIAYVWETINRLLTGHYEGGRLLLTVVAFILLIGLFRLLTRAIARWEGEPHR